MPAFRCALKASFSLSLLFLSMTVPVLAQSIADAPKQSDKSGQKNGKISTNATSVLARPFDLGSADYRLFRKDSRQVTFKLVTSWIPGENHKGMLRYKLTASPTPSTGSSAETNDDATNSPEAVEHFMNMVHGCTISLNLYDKDGFILRKHDVPFGFGNDAQAHVIALWANDSFQMDAADYRVWISEKVGGSWGIGWDCASL
jgi:hypothetical protein